MNTELLINAITHQSMMAADSIGLKLSATELLFVFESIGRTFVKERMTAITDKNKVLNAVAILDDGGSGLSDRVEFDAIPDTIMGFPVKMVDADEWPKCGFTFGDWGLYNRQSNG